MAKRVKPSHIRYGDFWNDESGIHVSNFFWGLIHDFENLTNGSVTK